MNLILMPVVCGVEMTKRTVESCFRQGVEGGVTVLAVDNGSRDGVGNYLRSLNGQIILQTYNWPRSLSWVWNNTLQWAFERLRLDHVLVVNNDVVLRPDTYRLLLADGGDFVTGVSTDDVEVTYHIAPERRRPHPCFSCFLIRRSVWERVGAFDEGFWAWANDLDYHLRMEEKGIEAYTIGVPFYHIGSGTLKNVPDEARENLHKLATQDREFFKRKWGCEVGSDEYYARFRNGVEYRTIIEAEAR